MHDISPADKVSTAALRGAQETLLVPLWARARESRQPNPVLVDRKAAAIVDAMDYDFSSFGTVNSVQLGCCIRAAVIDRWVAGFIERTPDATVVEIGAGLDTRMDRLDNGQVRWFDLDLPEAMQVRRAFFDESERRTFIAGSVFESDWIEHVKANSRAPYFLIAEGVLYYFPEQQVKELMRTLADAFPGCLLAFDTNTKASLEYSNRHGPLRNVSGQMVWSIEDVQQLNNWGQDFSLIESVAPWDHPDWRVYRRRLPRWLRFLHVVYPKTRRMHRMNLMRLGNPS